MIAINNESGICEGIINTLNIIYDTYESNLNKKIYIYNNFINNSKVIDELNNLGIEIIDDITLLTSDDILIINTYGVSYDILNYLKENKIEYIDTSCKKINNLKKEIFKKYKDDYEILIINNEYSEIINSWILDTGIIINDIDDLKNLEESKNKVLVGYDYFNDTNEIINYLKDNYHNVLIEKIILNCENHLELNELIEDNNITNKIIIAEEHENINNSFNNIASVIKYILESNLTKEDDINLIGSKNTTIKELCNYKYLISFLLYYKEIASKLRENQQDFNNKLRVDSDNELVNLVYDDISYLNQDGKYIRGVLIALGEYMTTCNNINYLDLAYAYELFQTSVLIHDDIIDNAKIRRGKDTIPRSICKKYLNKKRSQNYYDDTIRLANSIGICAGDYGFYLANKVIIDNYQNHKNFNKILDLYNDIVIKTIKGEIIDVYLPYLSKYNYKKVEEQDIIDIYHLKTSWYTIIGPMSLGYLLGENQISKELQDILNNIGILFQIKDDLLGIYGNTKVIGKQNTLDIEEFKQTLLYSYIMNTSYQKEFLKIYGKKNVSDNEVKRIKELLNESGAYEYVTNYLDDLYSLTINNIDSLELEEEYKDILKGLLIYILERNK